MAKSRPRTTVGTGLSDIGKTVSTRKVAASYYTGSGGGSCGTGLGMTFAELNMGTALGNLPCGTQLQVTYKGKTITVTKSDTGLGGPGIGGFPRAIDLYIDAARALGFPLSQGIIVVEVSGAGGGSPQSQSTSSTSGQAVDDIFNSYTALRDAPRGGITRQQQAEGVAYVDFYSGGPAQNQTVFAGLDIPSLPFPFGPLANVFGEIFGGSKTKKQIQQGGGLQTPTTMLPGGGFFSGIADAINSALDFLKWVAWIFHPVNLLRGVEFLVGIGLMAFGIHAALQAQREARQGGYRGRRSAYRRSALGRATSEATARTPVGRASRAIRGSRAGRRSARREQRYREYDRSYRGARRSQERKTRTTRTTTDGRTSNNGRHNGRKTKARVSAS